MLIVEELEEESANIPLQQIFATDLGETVITKAYWDVFCR